MTSPPRKGAVRMSDIPPSILRGLNNGTLESRTLVEWLAVDIIKLARAVARSAAMSPPLAELFIQRARVLAPHGIQARSKGMGAAVHEILGLAGRRRAQIYESLAAHTSDTVRAWAAYSLCVDESLTLAGRLQAARRFAADPNMGVRECAWDSWRPHFAREQKLGFRLLKAWVRDPDPSIRRCAVEGTRPRGVWTRSIDSLKSDPTPGLVLLEPVRSDPSDYVRKAVANWLNDASKSRPEWVREVCRRWLEESPTPETRWIVNRALRTLRKKNPA